MMSTECVCVQRGGSHAEFGSSDGQISRHVCGSGQEAWRV